MGAAGKGKGGKQPRQLPRDSCLCSQARAWRCHELCVRALMKELK